jgi:F0F1-type ATP synthase assembly protein I
MPGGRKTHHFPEGTPVPVVLTKIVAVIVGIVWVVSFSQGWMAAVAATAAWICVALIHSKLITHYEQRGLAVPIPRPEVTFPARMPGSVLILRYASVIVVLLMLGFGVIPMPWARAKSGIVGCVIGLLILSMLYIALMWHYGKTSRASQQ